MFSSRIGGGWSRRSFLAASGLSGVALAARPAMASATNARTKRGAVPAGFPHQDPGLVADVVRVSHFDLDAVRDLVTARPELAKASYDWGFGDWESALGAASHTGQRGIAELLIAHGARPNLFTFAMQGRLDAVRAIIEANPGVQRIPGPHGLTLLQHAENGGDDARAVYDYLRELGDADPRPVNQPLAPEEMKACLGTYVLDVATGTSIDILEVRGMLAVKHPDIPNRPLFHQGEYVFHPSGAPGFRFRFEIENGRAMSVTLGEGDGAIRAARIG